MPKASTRFRNRKINFKTRITIRTGCLDVPSDHEDEEFGFEEDRRASMGGTAGERIGQLETGVDKEEESEHHLQKVISASTAALLRSAVNEGLPASSAILAEATQVAAQNSSATSHQPAVPHIPIPDATGLVEPAAYEALYAHSKLFLPSSYIRFSDTVEDTLDNVNYTMDDEDEAWLKEYNSNYAARARSQDPSKSSSGMPGEEGKNKRPSARKGKEKERVEAEFDGPGPLSADDLERLMDHFEKTTEETVPGLHLDTNRLPSLADFEHTFEGTVINPRLSSGKIFAKFVYSHWKERRLKRGGKPIMPAIDFDESNENNPYVCFRRREIKTVRKTRRTDAQNMDRLIRLRDDLHKAQELLNTVLSRERVKREVVELEKAIFEGRCMVREMKRTLREPTGDENLLIDKKEKKRKREGSGFGSIQLSTDRAQHSIVKSPLRKAGVLSANSTGPGYPQDVLLLQEKVKATSRNMDRDLARRREEQNGWEDLTDSAYQSMALPASAMRWRGPMVSDTSSLAKSSRELASGFEQGIAFATPIIESNQYRRRIGRGGRFILDRIIAPNQRPARMSAGPFASTSTSHLLSHDDDTSRQRRLAERWRFDDDLRNEFPSLDDPPLIDDYSLQYVSKRRNLLDSDDVDCLQSHADIYLSRVSEYLNREPDPDPPVVKIGKLPEKPVPNLLNMGFARAQYPLAPSTLQEQMMAVQAAVHAQGNNAAHGKRAASGPAPVNGNSGIQMTPRGRRNPSGPAVPVNGSSSNPTSNSNRSVGWLNGTAPLTANTPGPNTNSPGMNANAATGQSSSQISVPYSGISLLPGGLARSIPIPANGSPAARMMNGINAPTNLSNGMMSISQSNSTNPQLRVNGSPSASRLSAASPPPQASISRHSSPSLLHMKSPGTRQQVKRPLSSLGVHQQSPPPNQTSAHPMTSTSPSPSPIPTRINSASHPTTQRIYGSPPSNHQLANHNHNNPILSPSQHCKPGGTTNHHQMLTPGSHVFAATYATHQSPVQTATPNPGATTTGV
ncbi:enhancer of polycomb-like-domain-containing protein [Melampsora americana]|nr:enhancer of polycomb-like-domain-containing protein [Melampsora americana]